MNMDLLRAGNLALAGPCVVCGVVIPPGREGFFCRQLLNNVNVGEFLVKLEVVPVQGVSLNSPICRCCLHFVTMADRAWVMVDESVGMLKMRREERVAAEEPYGPDPEVGPVPAVPSAGNAPRPVRDRRLVKPTQNFETASPSQKRQRVTADFTERRVSRRNPGGRGDDNGTDEKAPGSATRVAHPRHPGLRLRGRNDPGLVGGDGGIEIVDGGAADPDSGAEHAPPTLPSVVSVVSEAEDRRTCRVCGKLFTAVKKCLMHEAKFHAESPLVAVDGGGGGFGCQLCGRFFETAANRSRHAKMVHWPPPVPESKSKSKSKGKIVKCKVCGKLIRSAIFRRHMRRVHHSPAKAAAVAPAGSEAVSGDVGDAEAPRGFRCKICGGVIKLKTSRKRHLLQMHDIGKVLKKYKSTVCAFEEIGEEESTTESSIVANFIDPLSGGQPSDEPRDRGTSKKSKMAVPEVHVCDFCDQFFHSRAKLLLHVSREHIGTTEELPAVDGDNDDAVSSVSHSVSEDQSFSSSSGAPGAGADRITFGCPVCGRRFPKKVKRKAHVEALHPEACWCCGGLHLACREEEQVEGACGTCARVVAHLNAHCVWRHKAKYCPACHAPFASHAGLAAHALFCPLRADGALFQEAVDLEFQEPSVSQFQAPVASQFQEADDGLAVSDGELRSFSLQAKAENSLVCAFCPEVFPCESTLLQHVDQSHWACIKCPEVFNRKELFLEHLKTHSAAQTQSS